MRTILALLVFLTVPALAATTGATPILRSRGGSRACGAKRAIAAPRPTAGRREFDMRDKPVLGPGERRVDRGARRGAHHRTQQARSPHALARSTRPDTVLHPGKRHVGTRAPARNHLHACRIWLAGASCTGRHEERAECSDVAGADGTWTEPRPGRAAVNATIAMNSAPRSNRSSRHRSFQGCGSRPRRSCGSRPSPCLAARPSAPALSSGGRASDPASTAAAPLGGELARSPDERSEIRDSCPGEAPPHVADAHAGLRRCVARRRVRRVAR